VITPATRGTGPSAGRRLPCAAVGAALVCGCSLGGDEPVGADQARYQRALETATEDPAAAWDACATLRDAALRTDCRVAAVEVWCAHKDMPTADLLARCQALDSPRAAQECAFQVGERRRDPKACAQAGDFADDCRLHLLTATFSAWVPKDAAVDDPLLHQRLTTEAVQVGLDQEDPRAWSAWFRRVLDQRPAIDRSSCRELAAPLAEACWQTGRALYEDRLNMARDRGIVPCDGGAPPSFLATGGDAELDARREERMAQDLCAPQGTQ
jgi:hypothetical protein